MRFYQTSAGQYRDYAYQLPRELMMEAITYNDQMINNQRNLLGKAEAEFLSFDSLDKDDDAKREIISKYEGKIDELTKTINEDPMAWRSRKGDISSLGRELYKDWTMGDIHQITENLNARNTFVQNWKKLNAEKPDEYRSEDFNLALSNFDKNYQGYKSEDGDYQNYNTEELSRYINIDKFAEEMGEGYMADIEEKSGWFKSKDGYYYHKTDKTKRVSKEEIQQGLYQATMNDPDIWAYHDQMKKFYGEEGESFSKNYINKIENAVDRVSDKYSYSETTYDIDQMKVDDYAMEDYKNRARQEAQKKAAMLKKNPASLFGEYNLSQNPEHDTKVIIDKVFPSDYGIDDIYRDKYGAEEQLKILYKTLESKKKGTEGYDRTWDDIQNQEHFLDRANNRINNMRDLALTVLDPNQVNELELYVSGKAKFDEIVKKGDGLLSLINALDKPVVLNPAMSPGSAHISMQSFDKNEQLMRLNKVKQYQNEFNQIKNFYQFAKKMSPVLGMVNNYVKTHDEKFVEENTVGYTSISLSPQDIKFNNKVNDILIDLGGNVKTMYQGTQDNLSLGHQDLWSMDPITFGKIKEEKGLNPSDYLTFKNVYIGKDGDLRILVSPKNDVFKLKDMDEDFSWFPTKEQEEDFTISVPEEYRAEVLTLFNEDPNEEVRNIAYLSSNPNGVYAMNLINNLDRKADYRSANSNNYGVRGPVETWSAFGGKVNVKINTIGVGNRKWNYEIEAIGEDVPKDYKGVHEVTREEAIKGFYEILLTGSSNK